jgi:hypothetical protein
MGIQTATLRRSPVKDNAILDRFLDEKTSVASIAANSMHLPNLTWSSGAQPRREVPHRSFPNLGRRDAGPHRGRLLSGIRVSCLGCKRKRATAACGTVAAGSKEGLRGGPLIVSQTHEMLIPSEADRMSGRARGAGAQMVVGAPTPRFTNVRLASGPTSCSALAKSF